MQTDKNVTPSMRGTVAWFNDDKGFGFLHRDDGGPDCFVHFSAINHGSGRRTLLNGQRVEFEVIKGDKGPAAHNVKVVTE